MMALSKLCVFLSSYLSHCPWKCIDLGAMLTADASILSEYTEIKHLLESECESAKVVYKLIPY